MEELKQQIADYNRFMKAVVRSHFNGIPENHRAQFIEWVVMNIGRLFMQYHVLGDPEKVLSAQNVFKKFDA